MQFINQLTFTLTLKITMQRLHLGLHFQDSTISSDICKNKKQCAKDLPDVWLVILFRQSICEHNKFIHITFDY